jgi:hypothetical protein
MHGATASGSAGVLRASRVGSPRAAVLRAASRAEATGGHATSGEPHRAKGALDARWASRAKAARRAGTGQGVARGGERAGHARG